MCGGASGGQPSSGERGRGSVRGPWPRARARPHNPAESRPAHAAHAQVYGPTTIPRQSQRPRPRAHARTHARTIQTHTHVASAVRVRHRRSVREEVSQLIGRRDDLERIPAQRRAARSACGGRLRECARPPPIRGETMSAGAMALARDGAEGVKARTAVAGALAGGRASTICR
jgi:hypothetical protein